MARNSNTQAKEPEIGEAAKVPVAGSEDMAGMAAPGTDTNPDTPETGKPEPVAEEAPRLESLDALAASRRVPSWQQAALLRAMGWAEGKMVSAEEYDAALEQVQRRRMGSGRI